MKQWIWMAAVVAGMGLHNFIQAAGAPSAEQPKAQEAITFPKIDRRPLPSGQGLFGGGRPAPITQDRFPKYNPDATNGFQVDLRGRDLSALNLADRLNDLQFADFDTRTVWPATERMPKEFDWKRTLEVGKSPGLGVRKLHERGIKGRGVGIAIVDQPLLVDHQEYAERIRFYEEINVISMQPAQMHGAAVASIAVGKTVGVAPEADLYFIGTNIPVWGGKRDFKFYAQAVRRLLEINQQLPADRKIRVLSLSVGWDPREPGYEQMKAAAAEAKAAGLLVVSSSIDEVHGFRFHGLGRQPLADPEAFDSYEPGIWWARQFFKYGRLPESLLAPMDSRTTAGPGGKDEYVFYRQGGWSWTIPYLAGVYALAVQVDPAITPERFWQTALKTGRTIEMKRDGKTHKLGSVVHPPALIEAIEKR